MAEGQDDASEPEEGRILSPEELEIRNDEHVAELEEGRYVVSPTDPIDRSSISSTSGSASPPRSGLTDSTSGDDGVDLNEGTVHDWLNARFESIDSRYGYDVTATFDGRVRQRHMVSNDVVTIFETLLLWYGQQIDTETPVEEVLGILLMESNVPIRYPPASLQHMLEDAGLTPDDSIADLIQSVKEEQGLRL